MSHSEAPVFKPFHRRYFLTFAPLLMLGLCVCCDQRSRKEELVQNPSEVKVAEGEPPLTLGNAELVSPDGTVSMNLFSRGEAKFSSGEYRQRHNVLFIPGGEGAAHWLLADNTHHFSSERDIREKSDESSRKLATAVILQEKGANSDVPGRLILFDPTGTHVVEVAQNAASIELAARTKDDLTLLYRRGDHFVRATFDPVTLLKRGEREIAIPVLK